MGRLVHKYEVPAAGRFAPVPMPVAAEIIHADVQLGQIYVWALVDPDAPTSVSRRLGYFGTGQESIPLTARHVGTCIDRGPNLVWHVFEDSTDPRGGDADASASGVDASEAAPCSGAGAASVSALTGHARGRVALDRQPRSGAEVAA
jgi:hypothetical protein